MYINKKDLKNLIKIAFIFTLLLFVSSCSKHDALLLNEEITSENEVKKSEVYSSSEDGNESITDPENEDDPEIDFSITDPENEDDPEIDFSNTKNEEDKEVN